MPDGYWRRRRGQSLTSNDYPISLPRAEGGFFRSLFAQVNILTTAYMDV
jgi:hypothetical protein